MTKTIKKCLMAVLLFGLTIACAFVGFTATRAFADLTTNQQKFVNDYADFLAIADANEDGELSVAEIEGVKGNAAADAKFLSMYMYISNLAGGAAPEDAEYVKARTAYNDIIATYDSEGAVQLYSDLTTLAYEVYTMSGHSYKDAAAIAEFRASFEGMAGADLALLKNLLNWETTWVDTDADEVGDTPVQLINAEAKIAIWKAAIDNAIAAIQAIQVWNGVDAMIDIYNGVAYLNEEDYEVVIASEDSINTAFTNVEIVFGNGDLMFLDGSADAPYDFNHYDVLVDAIAGLAVQYAKVGAVEELIDAASALYSNVDGEEVCYTIYAELIAPAKAAYEALDDDTVKDGNNDLQSKVNAEKYTLLYDNMIADYNAVNTAIKGADGVEATIAAIPVASYTNAFKSKIDAARDAFDALPNDVKEAEDGTPGLYVANYQTLLNAEEAWADYVEEVEAVIAAINNLQNVADEDLFAEIIAMNDLYNGLSDKTNQLNGDAEHDILGVNATALDVAFRPTGYLADLTTCADAYAYYIKVMNSINSKVNPIKTAIEAIYATYGVHARYTDAFDAELAAITDAIAALPHVGEELDPRYKGAIDNYAKYETLANDYAELLALANAWADAVDEIGTVCVSVFDKIAAAVDAANAVAEVYAYATLVGDISTFAKEYNDQSYSAYYDEYTAAIAAANTIIEKLNEVKTLALALVRPDVANAENYVDFDAAALAYNTYNSAVETANEKYAALADYDVTDDETWNYFATDEDYAAAYEALVAANVYRSADICEIIIARISFFADDDLDYISDARDCYDIALAEAAQAEVRNYEELTAAEEVLEAWKAAVEAILEGAGFDGADVEGIAITAVTKANLTEGFYKLDVDAAKALRLAYNDEFSHVFQAYDGVAEDYVLLINAITVAGTNDDVVGAKLFFIDDAILDFYNAFNDNSALPYDINELKAYVAALDDSQVALLTNTEKLAAVEGSQKMAKELAAAIDALYADVAEEKVNVVSAIEYYTLSAIYNNLSVAKQDMVNAELAGDYDVEEAFEFIAEKVVDVDVNVADQIDAAIIAALDGEGAIEEAVSEAIASALAVYVTNAALEDVISAYLTSEAFDEAIEAYLTTAAFDEAIEAYLTTEAFNAAIANYVTSATFTTEIAKYLKTADFTTEIAKYLKTADFTTEIAKYLTSDAFNDSIAAYMTTEAFNAAKTVIENKITNEVNARKAADAEEKAAREEAIADLQAQIDALNTKSTVIIIVFAVVCAALCACVIVLFLKKKQA